LHYILLAQKQTSSFNGQDAKGNWTLRVRDAVLGNFGTINSASLYICNETFTLGTSTFSTLDFVLYPNPNEGKFTIKFESESINKIQVFIHDVLGKEIFTYSLIGQLILIKISNFQMFLQVSILSPLSMVIEKC